MAFGRRKPRIDEHRAADPQAVRNAALLLLNRREYAAAELADALLRKGHTREVVTEVVLAMQDERLLDDTRYTDSLVRQLAARGQGPVRIRQALQQAGIASAQAEAAIAAGPDWCALAREVRMRKFGTAQPRDWPGRARQMRFLQYRGFSNDHIGSCLGEAPGVPDSDQ